MKRKGGLSQKKGVHQYYIKGRKPFSQKFITLNNYGLLTVDERGFTNFPSPLKSPYLITSKKIYYIS